MHMEKRRDDTLFASVKAVWILSLKFRQTEWFWPINAYKAI